MEEIAGYLTDKINCNDQVPPHRKFCPETSADHCRAHSLDDPFRTDRSGWCTVC